MSDLSTPQTLLIALIVLVLTLVGGLIGASYVYVLFVRPVQRQISFLLKEIAALHFANPAALPEAIVTRTTTTTRRQVEQTELRPTGRRGQQHPTSTPAAPITSPTHSTPTPFDPSKVQVIPTTHITPTPTRQLSQTRIHPAITPSHTLPVSAFYAGSEQP